MARDCGMSADFHTCETAIDRARVQRVGKRARWRHPPIASAPPTVGTASRGMPPTIENHCNGDTPPSGEAGARAPRTIANHSNGEPPKSCETGERDSRTMENHSNVGFLVMRPVGVRATCESPALRGR